ncbi:MAG TPA: hypothetical protein VJL29_12670 [Thermoguttaceae bacterium]|nr:hypothetical protein [Thermoguttaceae bacterium]
MRKTLWFAMGIVALSMVLAWCPAVRAAADEAKPFFVASVSGYDALMADVTYIGKLGDNPNLPKALESLLKATTQGKGLAGIDQKRPWGVVVLPDPENPATSVRPFVFVPVTDFDALLETLQIFGIETEDADDGAKKLVAPGTLPPETFIKHVGSWVFLTNKVEYFKAAPADPIALLGGAEKKYDVALSLVMKNVPDEMKTFLTGQLDTLAQLVAMQLQNNADAQVATSFGHADAARVATSIEQLKRYVNELDAMTIGLSINADGKTYLDVETTALPDTETAAELAASPKAPSGLAGFYVPEATATAHWVGKFTASNVQQAKTLIRLRHDEFLKNLRQQNLEKDKLARVEKLSGDLVDVLVKTLEAKKADAGAAAWLGADQCTVVAGGLVADGKKLDATLREIAAMAVEESPEAGKYVKLDAQTHQGVALHTFTMPTEALGEEPFGKLFGEKLDVVVGVGGDHAYLGVGRDAMEKLKAAIDASRSAAGTDVLPTRVSLAVTPLVEFLGTVTQDDDTRQQIAMIAGVLKTAGKEDHVRITAEPIPGGVRQRVEIERGLLKTLGAMSQLATSMMMPMPPAEMEP